MPMATSPASRARNLPDTLDELDEAITKITEDLDSIDLFTAIRIVADALDLDLVDVLTRHRADERLSEGDESIIGDLIDASQSNRERALDALIATATLRRDMLDRLNS